jgi:carboxypeptidase Taq
MRQPTDFEELKQLSTEIHHYNAILGLLHWDQETYMPQGGIGPRSMQIALLSALAHEKKSSHQFKERLEKLISISSGKVKKKGLSSPQKVALREWRKEYIRATKLPSSFVNKFSQATSEATQVWASAKQQNNFKLFAPFLEKIIEMSREKAEILGFAEHPYDALLESYEPCMTTNKINKIFTPLRKELVRLLQKIQNAKQVPDAFLHKKVSDEKQMKIANILLKRLPIDENYSRLDLSAHPFSMALHPYDSRITTRVLPNAFMSNIFSVLHEAGHSMYEMGLPVETWGTPLSEAVSLSIHESQSRWWETLIGRNYSFWKVHYPLLQKELPTQLGKVSLEKFYRAINKVEPTLIRVEADEVTYCLHVIVRFEIEKALILGDLKVTDLPEAWKAKMQEYLEITPSNDSQGCLQDVHWSLGDFGYFPTYALGNICAAQFFDAFTKKHKNWEKQILSGDLSFIRDWLKQNIHQWGKTYNTEELIKKVSGKSLSQKPYCSYLNRKYSEIYNF